MGASGGGAGSDRGAAGDGWDRSGGRGSDAESEVSRERMLDEATDMSQHRVLPTVNKELVRRTVFEGATDDELDLYLHDCAHQGVHPLDRLIHPQIRKDQKTGKRRYAAVTSIDLMRSRAEDTGTYAGNDDPVFQGTPQSPWFEATVTVWKIVASIRCPFNATARWAEYKPPEDFMWKRMPHVMLGKVAEALALRKAFPRQLGGLYAREEMEQAGPSIIDVPAPPKTQTTDSTGLVKQALYGNGGKHQPHQVMTPEQEAKVMSREPGSDDGPPDADELLKQLAAARGTKAVAALVPSVKLIAGDDKSHPVRLLYNRRYAEEQAREKNGPVA